MFRHQNSMRWTGSRDWELQSTWDEYTPDLLCMKEERPYLLHTQWMVHLRLQVPNAEEQHAVVFSCQRTQTLWQEDAGAFIWPYVIKPTSFVTIVFWQFISNSQDAFSHLNLASPPKWLSDSCRGTFSEICCWSDHFRKWEYQSHKSA